MTESSTAHEGVDTDLELDAGAKAESHAVADVDDVEVESEEIETESDNTDGDDDADGEEEEAQEVEIDLGGNKLTLKRGEIPDDVLNKVQNFTKDTWASVTRKNQELSEQRKAVEAAQKNVEHLSSLEGEALSAYARGLQLKGEIDQLEQVNVGALWQSDPDRARRISDVLAEKRRDFQATVGEVNTHEAEYARAQEEEASRRMAEGRASVERRIKGFNAAEVEQYAIKVYGMTEEEAKTWPLNPPVAEMAHKAMLYDRMQAQRKKKPLPETKPGSPVKPIKGKGGGKGSLDLVRDADKISPDEWAKRRNAQIQRKYAGG